MTTMTISLPTTIAKKISDETFKKGFATRSEFIRSILRSYFSKELSLESFTPRPLEKIKLDLEKTGKYNQEFIDNVIEGLKKSSVYDR